MATLKGSRKQAYAMSKAWKSPQFTDVDGFVNTISVSEDAEFAPIFVRGKEVPKKVAIVGKDSEATYGFASQRYKIVQNQEVLLPVAMALQDMNIPVSGSVISEDGITRAILQVGEPIQLADSDYRMTITVYNSYNGELAFGGISGLLRLLCMNGMMDIQGVTCKVHQKHLVDFDDTVSKWVGFFEDSAKMAVEIRPIIDKALNEPIAFGEVEPVLRGCGLGERVTAEIVEHFFDKYCPDANKLGVNKWTVDNGVTNYYSHREKGNYRTNAEGLSFAGRFLQADLAEALKNGREILKKEADDKRSREALKNLSP